MSNNSNHEFKVSSGPPVQYTHQLMSERVAAREAERKAAIARGEDLQNDVIPEIVPIEMDLVSMLYDLKDIKRVLDAKPDITLKDAERALVETGAVRSMTVTCGDDQDPVVYVVVDDRWVRADGRTDPPFSRGKVVCAATTDGSTTVREPRKWVPKPRPTSPMKDVVVVADENSVVSGGNHV